MSIKLNSIILRNIDTIARELHTLYENKFKVLNLTKGQFLFLTRIYENQGISLLELSKQLKVDKTTAAKAVQKLVSAGYINKLQDNTDKRVFHLRTTSQANKTYLNIIVEKNKIIDLCFNNFSQDEIGIFEKLLNKTLENLTQQWQTLNKKRN